MWYGFEIYFFIYHKCAVSVETFLTWFTWSSGETASVCWNKNNRRQAEHWPPHHLFFRDPLVQSEGFTARCPPPESWSRTPGSTETNRRGRRRGGRGGMKGSCCVGPPHGDSAGRQVYKEAAMLSLSPRRRWPGCSASPASWSAARSCCRAKPQVNTPSPVSVYLCLSTCLGDCFQSWMNPYFGALVNIQGSRTVCLQ